MNDNPAFRPSVLVVDQDVPATRALLAAIQDSGGMSTLWARDGEAGYNILEDTEVELHALVCELKAQRIDGMRLLRAGLKRHPEMCVVLMSEGGDLAAATAAVRAGATDFMAKPPDVERLLATLRQGVSRQQLRVQVTALQERLSDRYGFERVAGRSRAAAGMLDRIRQAAGSAAPILLQGEAGAGKSLLAQVAHHNSLRRDEPYVTVQCSGLPEALVEEELFGRAAGRGGPERRGRMEIAARGSLFLHDVADLAPRTQARLLRAVRDGAFERVGDTETRRAEARWISATERDLVEEVRRGRFRDDLYAALAVAVIKVPALRERPEDIPLLTQALLEELNRAHGRQVTGVTRGCMDLLMQYPWPGNVRELKTVLEGVVVFVEGRRALEAGDLPEHLRDRPPAPRDFRVRVGMSLAEIERRALQETLAACAGDKPRAAKMLGIGLRTLYRKVKEYEIP
ncbi:MAG: sigma-54-dependent Fis family transcriptional regulator [Candidatus Eisenbacteria bacterium]|nr:sigma-54-dependent Fis family transcriptional regulator [Candidatus Eisenbacteria bacterium]